MDICYSSDDDDQPNIQAGNNNKMLVDTRNGIINCLQMGPQNTIVLDTNRIHELPQGTEVKMSVVIRKASIDTVETHITISGNTAAEERLTEVANRRGVWDNLRQFFNTLYAGLERIYRGSVVLKLHVTDSNFLHCIEKAAKEGRLNELILNLIQEEGVFDMIKGQKVEITVEVRIPEDQYEEMSKEMERKKQTARKLVENLLDSSRNEEIVQQQSVTGLRDVAGEVQKLGNTLNGAMVGGAALGTAALIAAPFTFGASIGLGTASILALIGAFVLAIWKSQVRKSAQGRLEAYNDAVKILERNITTVTKLDDVMKDFVESAVIERLKVEPIMLSNMMISLQQSAGSASKLVVNVNGEEIPLDKLDLYEFIKESVKNKMRSPSKVTDDIYDMARQIERIEVNPFRRLQSTA
ncbi:uncharacterized protein LOC124286076 [Haliotis rubra]|uniref:uncharacterized protein LOC124286076 n=1 Tax=Haliotis rubra TaxID=36100 RepID=UPI001EE58EB0|nr:uncharacterized protein LOC124286076 [Haliotis rubra]XP_046578355.1 uncharacterized protein LOC124286076 [Haliotis rubra]XP_046578356.1 uncharacterized protein LOC124286076 [Haliotis rubra]